MVEREVGALAAAQVAVDEDHPGDEHHGQRRRDERQGRCGAGRQAAPLLGDDGVRDLGLERLLEDEHGLDDLEQEGHGEAQDSQEG